MPSDADISKAFYAAQLGLTDAQMSTRSIQQLRNEFQALAFTKTPSPKATVAVGTNAASTGVISPANAAYTVADQTALANAAIDAVAKHNSLVTQFNALRTALINAGLIQ